MITEIEKQNIIKSILNIRCRTGATIAEIEDDYEEITGEPLLNASTCLNTIDCVYYEMYSNGTTKWFVKSENVEHITKMILKQRPAQQQPYNYHHNYSYHQQQKPYRKPQHELNDSVKSNDCFFKDNIIYKLRKMHSKYQELIGLEDVNNNSTSAKDLNSVVTSPPPAKKQPPIRLHAQLVGDHFVRTLATGDTIDNMFNRNNAVHPIGFCVSGQTISVATKHIKMAQYFKASHLILNVGTVDILNGQALKDICIDFDHLIAACKERGCNPIITTLAPLVSGNHSQEIHNKLSAFNSYLLNTYSVHEAFIDIWEQFVQRNGRICLNFFENQPTYVNGCNAPQNMWSNEARLVIRSHIVKRLHTILKIKRTERIHLGA